jgi:CRISPR-associated protein Cas1
MEKLDYIPISALAEIAYCPKNFYYRMIEGIEDKNFLMIKGEIEDEQRKEREKIWREQDIHQVRFIPISSENLRLIGIVDAIEERGDLFPIEYKTGEFKQSLRDDIQLCAEAMVLEEEIGRTIPYGYIYYAESKKRRKVLFQNELREKVLFLIQKAFDILEGEDIPEPVNDARCNGCSLQSLCLPEEISYLKDKEHKPRKPVPSLRLNRVLYIDEQGAYLKKEKHRVIVTKNREKIMEIPLVNLDEIVFVGNVNFSSQLLKLLLKRDIRVSYITTYGHYEGSFQPELSKNSHLRICQFRKFFDEKFKLNMSKKFIEGKISNMRTLLLRYNRALEDDKIQRVINNLKINLKELKKAKNINQILGIEGISTRNYFSVFKKVIKNKLEFDFDKRTRRPPRDPVNALLSLGYTLLLKDIIGALHYVGLDPYVGYFHSAKYGRPSLALDIMEEFRPIIVDSLVFTLINKGIIYSDDFGQKIGSYYLKERARAKYFTQYEQRKKEEIIHPIFGYRLPYHRIFELQVRFLAKVLTGEIDEYIPLKVR